MPNSFVALPPELGVKAPARLVFSAADLAQCWNDATARRCVLRGAQQWVHLRPASGLDSQPGHGSHTVNLLSQLPSVLMSPPGGCCLPALAALPCRTAPCRPS